MVLGLPAKVEAAPAKAEEKQPEAAPVEEKKVEPAPVAEAKPAESSRVLKHLSCWVEAIARVANTDGAAASYLKQTKAYTDSEGKIHILVPDPFTMMMVEGARTRNSVRAALSVCLKREIPDSALLFERSDSALPDDEEDLIIDQILQNAK